MFHVYVCAFIWRHVGSCTQIAISAPVSVSSDNSPRSVLLLFSLHHVTETSVGEGLGEVSVRRHEAVVVEAWSQAG